MTIQASAADLVAAPKARWALAWLAAPRSGQPRPVDFRDAATARPRATRLHPLRHNHAGLLAEIHNRVEDWRYQRAAHTGLDTLGPPDGYLRLATALTKAPAAGWWWQPVRGDSQVWICDQPIRQGRGLPFSTSYAHHWDATAPATALTTSTRLPHLPAVALLADQNTHHPYRTPPGSLSAWRVPVRPDARIAEIHSPADWVALVQRYPSHRTDLCLAPQLQAQWPTGALPWSVDWKGLSQDYDGVHLSVAGWLTATSRLLPLPDRDGYTFCEGWPTEATRWFRPVFSGEFERLPAESLEHPLEYGYGRPCTGSSHDLTAVAPVQPWWWSLLP
jgi:hypothetical protein